MRTILLIILVVLILGGVTDVAIFRWLGVLSERGLGTASTDRIDFGRAR